jgi:glucose-1-phosphate adenylyltransferase
VSSATAMEEVLGVVLGGGQGTRLYPLTLYRSKPAVPIGDKYRLIDIPISNCLHSNVNKIFVLTQFNSASLHRHISSTYRFDLFTDAFVEILAAEQTTDNTTWYQGTADAVRKQLRHIQSRRCNLVLILSGDHLYHMDYRPFVAMHRNRDADVTIAVKPVTREQAPGLGILKVGPGGRIVDFREKPQTDAELDELQLPEPAGGNPEARYLASMGIYLFAPETLVSLLMGNTQDDFGRHVIPEAIRELDVYAYPFNGYWEDIGNIATYYRAVLALTDPEPPFDFYDRLTPIYTHPNFLAGARLTRCQVDHAIIGEGCTIRDAEIRRSVLGIRSVVSEGTYLRNTVMMGADHYETAAEQARQLDKNSPCIGVGRNASIDGAIIDKNARIGDRVTIRNDAGIVTGEGPGYYIRDGIVVIPKGATIAAGTVI